MIHLYIRLMEDTRIKHVECEEFHCFTEGTIDCMIENEPEEIDNLVMDYVKDGEVYHLSKICDIEVY